MPDHSPLPWCISDDDKSLILDAAGEIIHLERHGDWWPNSRDVSLTVRAVNCHAELVDQLSECRKLLALLGQEHGIRTGKLATVLAKAKGEA